MTVVGAPAVEIGDRPLRVDDVVAIADGAPVAITREAQGRIVAARRVVDDLVNGETLIYGLNTGLGHMRNERMPVETLREYQVGIVIAHDGAIGPPLPTRVVRAAMVARVAGLAVGMSGASPGVAETLIAMLNRGVHPIVATTGSVGAADLMHMGAIALVATALGGRAEYRGEVLDGAEAMRRAGVTPLSLQPKDGLALISANGVSVGAGALVAARARAIADAADLIVAASMEAVGGNPSIVDPAVARAKPVPGQAASADVIRAILAGSDRCAPGASLSVQDPLSFRVAPQVHGAYRDVAGLLTEAVELELASSDDNPMVSVADGRLISNGNFHPMALALAADALRPALAHLGQLSDRRMNHLWQAAFESPTMTDPAGIVAFMEQGSALYRYAAAARYTELRALADPITLDVAPLDLGVEDHSTNAPVAVLRTDSALDVLEDVFVVELLMADTVLRANPSAGRLGVGVAAALALLAEVRRETGLRAPSYVVHAAVRAALLPRIVPAGLAAAAVGAVRE